MDKVMKSRRTHKIDTALEQERLMVETEKIDLGRERLALEKERSEFDRGDARLARLIELVLKWSLQSGEVQPVPRPFPEPTCGDLVVTEYQATNILSCTLFLDGPATTETFLYFLQESGHFRKERSGRINEQLGTRHVRK
jgi:hypothetical protein